MWLLAVFGCRTQTLPSATEPRTVDSTWPDELWTCGPHPPSIDRFHLENGSETPDARGASLLLELQVTDPDGDLAPELQVALFWDDQLDGALEPDAAGIQFRWEVEGDACSVDQVHVLATLPIHQLVNQTGRELPYDSCLAFQARVTGPEGTRTGDGEAHTAVSDVILVRTPREDGTDGTTPCAPPDTGDSDTGA